MPKVTPSRQQYLDIKAQHPDAIVFFASVIFTRPLTMMPTRQPKRWIWS